LNLFKRDLTVVDEEEQSIPTELRLISRDDGASIVDACVHKVVLDDHIQSKWFVHFGHPGNCHLVACFFGHAAVGYRGELDSLFGRVEL